jgi:hypothetical protein
MDLLTNAIESLRAGVEDYGRTSHARLLSAVRSIHAGILLLYKEALRRTSPADSSEVLVKAKVLPRRTAEGKVQFVGAGTKTVDVQQIRERFEALGIITDWTRFERITRMRNEIEHYYTVANKRALAGVVSNAFIVVRNFITAELEEDPRKLLGDETWQTMLGVSEVYEVERAECEESLAAVDWESEVLAEGVMDLTCPSCSGNLLRPDGEYKTYQSGVLLRCRACGEAMEASIFVPQAIAFSLGEEKYFSYKEGGETPYTACPDCGAAAYVMAEKRCALCGEEAEHICSRCGLEIIAEEL